jgi:hypothetical protein
MLALNNARMALWESTVVENRIDKGDVIWNGNGASLLGIQSNELRHGFTDFLQCVYEDDRDYVQSTIQNAIDKTNGYELNTGPSGPMDPFIGLPHGMTVWESYFHTDHIHPSR